MHQDFSIFFFFLHSNYIKKHTKPHAGIHFVLTFTALHLQYLEERKVNLGQFEIQFRYCSLISGHSENFKIENQDNVENQIYTYLIFAPVL